MISTLFLQQNVVKIKREQAWSYQNHIFLAGEKSQETIQMLTPCSLSLLSAPRQGCLVGLPYLQKNCTFQEGLGGKEGKEQVWLQRGEGL